MPRKFDPKYNDDDRHTQDRWEDARDRIRREAGGIDHVPDRPFIPSAGGADGPDTPSESSRDHWRKVYAGMSLEELRGEEDELYDEILRLAKLPYVDEHGHAMNEMKRELIKEALEKLHG